MLNSFPKAKSKFVAKKADFNPTICKKKSAEIEVSAKHNYFLAYLILTVVSESVGNISNSLQKTLSSKICRFAWSITHKTYKSVSWSCQCQPMHYGRTSVNLLKYG